MTTKTTLIILSATAVLVAAPFAFADNITQSGAGNSVVSQNGAGNTIINGSGNNSPGSNSPHLSATGGSASAHSSASANSRNTNVNVNSNSARQGQKQGQLQGQSQSADNAGNSQAVTQNYQAQARNPVSTAFAAPLVATGDCMGSSSAGGQGVGFGLSLGTTWHDEDCERRHDAITLHNMGQKKAALALLCQNDRVAEAMAAAGTVCPGRGVELDPAAGGSDEPVREHVAHKSTPTEGVVYEYPTGLRRGW